MAAAAGNGHLGVGTACDPNRAEGQRTGGQTATPGHGEGLHFGFLMGFGALAGSLRAPRGAGVHRDTDGPRFPGGIRGAGEGWRGGGMEGWRGRRHLGALRFPLLPREGSAAPARPR